MTTHGSALQLEGSQKAIPPPAKSVLIFKIIEMIRSVIGYLNCSSIQTQHRLHLKCKVVCVQIFLQLKNTKRDFMLVAHV